MKFLLCLDYILLTDDVNSWSFCKIFRDRYGKFGIELLVIEFEAVVLNFLLVPVFVPEVVKVVVFLGKYSHAQGTLVVFAFSDGFWSLWT